MFISDYELMNACDMHNTDQMTGYILLRCSAQGVCSRELYFDMVVRVVQSSVFMPIVMAWNSTDSQYKPMFYDGKPQPHI